MGARADGWLYCAEGSNIGAAFYLKTQKKNWVLMRTLVQAI